MTAERETPGGGAARSRAEAIARDPVGALSHSEPVDALTRLAQESGGILGELGVRPGDDRWIRAHADAIESLRHVGLRRSRFLDGLYRFARKAARTAR